LVIDASKNARASAICRVVSAECGSEGEREEGREGEVRVEDVEGMVGEREDGAVVGRERVGGIVWG
jgi:hypothetical protein